MHPFRGHARGCISLGLHHHALGHDLVLLGLLGLFQQHSTLLAKTSAKEWLLTSGSALITNIKAAKDHVHAAKPAGVCPLCGGKGCAKCFETGWMNSARLSSARKSR